MSARTYPCCDCCPDDDPAFHAENPPDSHDVPCDICSPTCGHNVERIRREARAEGMAAAADLVKAEHGAETKRLARYNDHSGLLNNWLGGIKTAEKVIRDAIEAD